MDKYNYMFYNKSLDDGSLELINLMKNSDFESLTIKEIQEKTGINHPQKLYNRLNKLIKDGFITEDYEVLNEPEKNKVFLAFYGWAQCGNNGNKLIEEYPRKRIEIDKNIIKVDTNKLKNYFITRAKGKSMEPKINTGDNLLVEFSEFIGGNYNYLIQHNSKSKIKQISKKGKKYFLHSLSEDFPDLEVKESDVFNVIGIVREIGIDI